MKLLVFAEDRDDYDTIVELTEDFKREDVEITIVGSYDAAKKLIRQRPAFDSVLIEAPADIARGPDDTHEGMPRLSRLSMYAREVGVEQIQTIEAGASRETLQRVLGKLCR
jgi:hypothetical protein